MEKVFQRIINTGGIGGSSQTTTSKFVRLLWLRLGVLDLRVSSCHGPIPKLTWSIVLIVMTSPVARESLLKLYKQILRACETYPSRNRKGIYQAIREEWRDNRSLADPKKLDQQISVAYKGLQQLRQFDEYTLTGGNKGSPNWSVTLEQNPMPKPADYDERKQKQQNQLPESV